MLEAFLSSKRREWLFAISIVILFLVPYSVVGHLPLARTHITFLPGEAAIPFLPWTFIVYLSVFVQAVVCIRFIPKRFLLTAVSYAFGLLFVALVCFVLWPIAYPRELYPTIHASILFFRTIDPPGNSFPSLHVAMSFFLTGCYTFFATSRTKRILFWIWSILISFSVLTTKQHYIIDIFGGVILAAGFLLLIRRSFALLLKNETQVV